MTFEMVVVISCIVLANVGTILFIYDKMDRNITASRIEIMDYMRTLWAVEKRSKK